MHKITYFVFVLSILAVAGYGQQSSEVNEVLIGYFGPNDPNHPEAGGMWSAASMAIDQANQRGGYHGIDFRLVTGWSDNPWGSGVSEVVGMAYTHKVWGIVGGIDGPSTHLAEQVVAKAHLTLISAGSTDKSVNFANVPWMFSCLPADDIQAEALTKAIAANGRPFILLSSTGHDPHLFTIELNKSFIKYKISPINHFEFKPKQKDNQPLIDNILETNASALVLIAGVDDSIDLVRSIQDKGFSGTVFGGPSMGHHRFVQNVPVTSEKLIFPLLYYPSGESRLFDEEFKRRFGREPDYLAAHTYDALNLLIASIEKAGLDREKIRDAMKYNSPTKGITGTFSWNQYGENVRDISLGCFEDKSVKVFSDY
ncbi:MAG: ABC transporter substrate-binding protein [Deltaproteobacteria bacterium]|nr:ABC transporter substrate-binding protein [Deltaproteobacteria bacterium]